MEPIKIIAPAKLTLSLQIAGVREDGMHLIEAEMVTVSLFDKLTITPGESGIALSNATLDVPIGEDNTVSKALKLANLEARIELEKNIPSKAGLGGGSADAAAVLRWAGYSDVITAAEIGADVAFCLLGGRARVSGIGEIVEPLEFQNKKFTLLTPPINCSTPTVYKKWDDLGGPKGDNGNDLEPAALVAFPDLQSWKDKLGNISGKEPRLAGSGSTWFVEGKFEGPGLVNCETVRY